MNSLLVALLLSQAVAVKDGYIRVDGSDEAIQVRGGIYLDSPTAVATGQKFADLRAQNLKLTETPAVLPAQVVVPVCIALVAGFILGGYTVYKVTK